MKRLRDRLDAWYDRQSIDVIFLLAVSPLILVGVVCLICALVFG